MLSNIIAIYRKELQSYFASPLAYIIAGLFWLITGYFLVAMLLGDQGIINQIAMRDQMGITDPPIDAPYEFLQFYLRILGSMSLFILPMLSMGLYAEERKLGTLELLATSPLTNWSVAVGKLLGVLTFFLTLILPLIALETLAIGSSQPPVSPVILLLGHTALLLLAASVLSLGMFISSLTDKTIISAIFTFGLVLFLWIIDVVASNVGGVMGQILGHLSLLTAYNNLIKGVVDSSNIIMLFSYIILGIFLTAQSIDWLRFQRS